MHGRRTRTSSFVWLTFRLSRNDVNRWFLWWLRAHIVRKDRGVKYNHVYNQIKAAVQKYCEKEKWRWKKLSNAGFWRKFGWFLAEIVERWSNCNMSTFLLGTFLTAETKGKFTCRRSDFSIFNVAFLDLYFDSILANHVESFFFWLFHIKYVIFDVLVSDLLCFHWPRRCELKSFRKKGMEIIFALYIIQRK